MASGLPTLCADAPGSKSLVQHGVTGFLVDASDVDGFVARARVLVEKVELRRAMAASALRAAQSYSWDKTFATLWQYYAKLDGRRNDNLAATPRYQRVHTHHGMTTPRQ